MISGAYVAQHSEVLFCDRCLKGFKFLKTLKYIGERNVESGMAYVGDAVDDFSKIILVANAD